MKNINIGTVSLMVSEKLKDSYFSDNRINESKDTSQLFFETLKSSPLLQLEFGVFNNIESKCIDNDVMATRYIDKNIALFETYTIDEIQKEREKIKKFYDDGIVLDEKKRKLYESINTLIYQSLQPSEEVDVDAVHESFTVVLNHIKTPIEKRRDVISENLDIDKINDDIIEIAISKFNEKYGGLNEEDKNLLIKLIKSNDNEKRQLFEEYKKESLSALEAIEEGVAEEKRKLVLEKIKGMGYDPKTVNESIIKLHELKTGLI
jgi:hypothetical protein